ncbi:hypothetical protein ACHAQE_001813 [Botrytis cinerea]
MEAVNKETNASYQPLSNFGNGEGLSASKKARLLPRLSPQCFLACNVAILLLNVFVITVFMSWGLANNVLRATDCILPPRRSLYVRSTFEVSATDLSPAPNDKLLQRQQHTFTLFSVWSGAPSNETGQAWKSIAEDNMGGFSISVELFQQVNPSLETGIRVPHELEDKYVVTFDVLRKLHCLVSELAKVLSPLRYLLPVRKLTLMCQNLIRQSFYPDSYPDYQGFNGHTSEGVQVHREHCI